MKIIDMVRFIIAVAGISLWNLFYFHIWPSSGLMGRDTIMILATFFVTISAIRDVKK